MVNELQQGNFRFKGSILPGCTGSIVIHFTFQLAVYTCLRVTWLFSEICFSIRCRVMLVIPYVLHCCVGQSKVSCLQGLVLLSVQVCGDTERECCQDIFNRIAIDLEEVFSQKSESCIPQGDREGGGCLSEALLVPLTPFYSCSFSPPWSMALCLWKTWSALAEYVTEGWDTALCLWKKKRKC